MNLLCLWTTWMWKYTSFKSIVTNLESETWWFSSSASWTSLCKGKNSGRRPSLEQGSNSWRTLVRCPTEVFPLSLLSVGGRKTLAVEQKHWRRCFRSLGGVVYYCQLNPVEAGGDFSQTEVCNRTESCGEPKAIPLVDAPIREWNAIEKAECRAKEDIPEMGCREGLEAAAPSTTKESPLRPCSGWRRVKCWTDGRPARGPNAAGENRLAAKGRAVAGERRTRPPTARPRKN